MAEEQKKIGFALRNITTEQFAIIEPSFKETMAIELKANLKFGIDAKNKVVSVLFSTNFIQEKNPFLKIEVGCHFTISEEAFNGFLNIGSSEITFPKGFMGHLVMLTIGTTRGILHAKTENTPFNQYFLPTLNVYDMVTKDVTFKV